MKKIFLLLILSFLIGGCGNDGIPKGYLAVADKDAYKVEVDYPQEVSQGETFHINVTSTNISGKTLYGQVCSSNYKLGARILVYTVVGEEEFYLQNEFEIITDDVRVEKITKNEILIHSWRFDGTLEVARHGKHFENGIYSYKQAPKGIYNISISTGEIIKNAFEII